MNQQILVLDEPSYGQDSKQKRKLGNFLQELKEQGVTVIIVSHDIEFILDFVERVIVLSDGKIIADGKTADILSNKENYQFADLVSPLMLDLSLKLKQKHPDFPKSVNESDVIKNIINLLREGSK